MLTVFITSNQIPLLVYAVFCHNNNIINPRARMRNARVIVVGQSVCFSVSPHVFSLTVAAVDAKRGCGYMQRALGTARV